MYTIATVIGLLYALLFFIYVIVFHFFQKKIRKSEQRIVDIFLEKMSKIPAVIEVMRPHVVDEHLAFDLMTHLHSEGIIYEYDTIYALLEHDARINDQYGFLMRLSMAIPYLQKDSYFVYIREFVISYDRAMRSELPIFNTLLKKWNRFIFIKNITIFGYILPGIKRIEL